MIIHIGIADDHRLFCKSLGVLIDSYRDCEVIIDALNGEELLHSLELCTHLPDIILVDVSMPVMDGPGTVLQIVKRYPMIRIAALSMKDDDISIIRMIRSGCCAYLHKDIHPDDLEKALLEIYTKGYYNADPYNVDYRRLVRRSKEPFDLKIGPRERQFLNLASSDLTYKQIAAAMFLSERTIDGYRESLFEKLKVKSRVGMVMEALRQELVTL